MSDSNTTAHKSAKKRRRWWLLLLWLPVGLLLVSSVLWFVLTTTQLGRDFVTRAGNSALNTYLTENAQIGSIELQLPPRILLSDVVIYDHRDSILFKAEALRVTPVWPPVQDSVLLVDQAILSHFEANVKQYEGDTAYNYTYALKLKANSGTKSSIQNVQVRKLIFEEGAFDYADYTKGSFRKKDEYGIDFYRLHTNSINGVLDSIRMERVVRAKLKNFTVRESSGFVVRKLDADMLITSSSFSWIDLDLSTNDGMLEGDLDFEFSSWKSWSNFNDSVRIWGNIRESDVFTSDLAYFSEAALAIGREYRMSGIMDGPLSDFSVEQLYLSASDDTYLEGDVDFKGLPDIESTFIRANIDDSRLRVDDINDQLQNAAIPNQLKALGEVTASGSFEGRIDSFHVKASASSLLGAVNTNSDVQFFEDGSQNHYSGALDLREFNLGAFLSDDELGTVNLTSELDIQGNSQANIKGRLLSEVTHFEYKGYDYRDVEINGKVANYFFDGDLVSKDPNAFLEVTGKIDFSKSLPLININADVGNLDLGELNLSEDSIQLRTLTQMNFEGNSLKNFVGEIFTTNLFVKINGKEYTTGETNINGRLIEGGKRWTLNSDIATASIETSVPLQDVPVSLARHGLALLPKDMGVITGDKQDFLVARARVLSPEVINSFLPGDMQLSSGTKVEVALKDQENIFKINVSAPDFEIAGVRFEAPRLTLNREDEHLTGGASFTEMEYDSVFVQSYQLDIRNDSSFVYVEHKGRLNDTLLRFDLNHQIAYSNTSRTDLSIDQSSLNMMGHSFLLSCDSIEWARNNVFSFDHLNLRKDSQYLEASGYAGIDGSYDFDYVIKKLSLDNFTDFLPEYFAELEGEVNGKGHVRKNGDYPIVEASLAVSPFYFKELDIASINIESSFNAEATSLKLLSTMQSHSGQELVKINGGVRYGNDPSVDLFLYVNDIPNAFFQNLATDIVSNLEGTVSSRMRYKGSFEEPVLHGWLAFENTAMHVDYLGTDYRLQDTFVVNSKNIHFDNTVLTDARGNKAVVNGKIVHDRLSRFDLDLDLEAENFTVLKTKEEDNELYYGNFYATGKSKFTGPILQAHVWCDLTTEEGTRFFLPIQEDQGYSQESFIRFINVEEEAEEYEVADKEFSLDLNINVNPKAETQLIFDKKLGDIIKATGNGRINMALSATGELEMFGEYVIDQGNYLFTAFDLINKRFEIQNGSKVSWVGDPYNALIDIRANYYLKANAYNLAKAIPQYDENRLEQYNTPVPVVAYADLKGSLLRPEISLDFEFIDEGGADVASLQRELDNMQLSEEELTKQVVSLLVLNRFMPIYSNGAATANSDIFGSSVNAGLGDLISNQLTYWLSSISDDIEVNLNYRGAYESDGVVLTQSELELALSTTLFNDRISLNYTYEFQNGYSPNKEIAYKVAPDGTVKVLVFQRQTNNPANVTAYNSNTYGLGVFLKREFENFKDLFKKKEPDE